eukprot:CAMPEP_0117543338 /NCGR_PEP_ID=MMETSP0784-20121206/45009_1 /TAXON_ID=39447 /ORGANISM="" /LENGTH=223 /DNA_ID=CAMNT_0005340113 /DNA_START=37 /DNA_END=708 /DNA_ORIENTATION=+
MDNLMAFRVPSADVASPSMVWPETPTPHFPMPDYSFGVLSNWGGIGQPSAASSAVYFPAFVQEALPPDPPRVPADLQPHNSMLAPALEAQEYPSPDLAAGQAAALGGHAASPPGFPQEVGTDSEDNAVAHGVTDVKYFGQPGMNIDPSTFTAARLGLLPSLGSELHGTGKCNPCAWTWKRSGCKVGALCNFCHLCPEDELKKRKKAKIARLRSEAQRQRPSVH